MAEVKHEDTTLAWAYLEYERVCQFTLSQAFASHRESAFAAGRASVLSDLESPTEAMIDAGRVGLSVAGWDDVYDDDAISCFAAMIRAYKEAGQ